MKKIRTTRSSVRRRVGRRLRNSFCYSCCCSGPTRGPGMAPARHQFILPFGAGSATDLAARLMGERLTARWGKPVIIENRPGGDGLVAINAFLSANDDHVLLYASSASFLAHPYTQEKLPYVLERDLAPIARVTDTVLSVASPAHPTSRPSRTSLRPRAPRPRSTMPPARRACRNSRSMHFSRART